MTFMRIITKGSLLVVLCLTACAKPQQTQQSHELISEAKGLELAKAEFAKTGRKVNDYSVTFETDSTGQKWIAWFDKKGAYATLGGKHAVAVEKATGKTIFMPGE